MTLGVGKLNDKRLAQALLNFMHEGIRFAFEGDVNGDDDLVLGSRLPFLDILSKYSNWFKRDNEKRNILAHALFAKEAAMRSHPEFDEVHEDDLRCIEKFRESLGIEGGNPAEESSVNFSRNETVGTPGGRSIGSTGARRKLSTAGSQRSRISVQSNLSPLLESPAEKEESPSPHKRRRLEVSLEDDDESMKSADSIL